MSDDARDFSVLEQRLALVEQENAELRADSKVKAQLIQQLRAEVAQIRDAVAQLTEGNNNSRPSAAPVFHPLSESWSEKTKPSLENRVAIDETTEGEEVRGLAAVLISGKQKEVEAEDESAVGNDGKTRSRRWEWEVQIEGYLVKDAPWLPRLVGIMPGSLNVYKPHWTAWTCLQCQQRNPVRLKLCSQTLCGQTRPDEVYQPEPLDRLYLSNAVVSSSSDGQTYSIKAAKIPSLVPGELRLRFASSSDAQEFRSAVLAACLATESIPKEDVLTSTASLRRAVKERKQGQRKARAKHSPSPSVAISASPIPQSASTDSLRRAPRLVISTTPSPPPIPSPFGVEARPDLGQDEGL